MSREQPVPPIVARDDAPEAVVFRTVEIAAGHVEAHDVLDSEWTAWDSRGYRLTLLARSVDSPVEIWWEPETSGPPEPEVVATLLRDTLRRVTRHSLELTNLQTASPLELIAEAQRLDALPGPFVGWLRRLTARWRTE